MGIIAWIVLGLIAGAIAKYIMPGRDPGGIIVTIILASSEPSSAASSRRRSITWSQAGGLLAHGSDPSPGTTRKAADPRLGLPMSGRRVRVVRLRRVAAQRSLAGASTINRGRLVALTGKGGRLTAVFAQFPKDPGAAPVVHVQLRIIGDTDAVFADNDVLRLENRKHRLDAAGLSISGGGGGVKPCRVNQRRRHLFRRSVEAEFSW
jgi:hypothetical protein